MKKTCEIPEMEVIKFSVEDVLTASGTTLPDVGV